MSTNMEVIIRSSQKENLPGIKLDSTLLFENHVKNLCKKASQTLHAHARVVSCMDLDKQKCLMKAFVMAQFNNCQLVWMFYSKKLNNYINKIHNHSPLEKF